jgi:hypothetical protein
MRLKKNQSQKKEPKNKISKFFIDVTTKENKTPEDAERSHER